MPIPAATATDQVAHFLLRPADETMPVEIALNQVPQLCREAQIFVAPSEESCNGNSNGNGNGNGNGDSDGDSNINGNVNNNNNGNGHDNVGGNDICTQDSDDIVIIPDLFVSFMSLQPQPNPHYEKVKADSEKWIAR